jgi:hypothetical protein
VRNLKGRLSWAAFELFPAFKGSHPHKSVIVSACKFVILSVVEGSTVAFALAIRRRNKIGPDQEFRSLAAL